MSEHEEGEWLSDPGAGGIQQRWRSSKDKRLEYVAAFVIVLLVIFGVISPILIWSFS